MLLTRCKKLKISVTIIAGFAPGMSTADDLLQSEIIHSRDPVRMAAGAGTDGSEEWVAGGS